MKRDRELKEVLRLICLLDETKDLATSKFIKEVNSNGCSCCRQKFCMKDITKAIIENLPNSILILLANSDEGPLRVITTINKKTNSDSNNFISILFRELQEEARV